MGAKVKYKLTLHYHDINRTLVRYYDYPPTRIDAEAIVLPLWRRAPRDVQDETWELILLLDFIPAVPWVGSIDTYYGRVTCKEMVEFKAS